MDSIEQARKILRSDIPWLELDISFNADIWKQQALEAEPHYQEYREGYSEGWSGCCLHGWSNINWHTDGEIPLDMDPLLSILPINIAIAHPNNCEMFIEDKKVPWKEGKIIMINISKKHAVFNRSSKPRVHMIANIILGHRTAEFCEMLVRCYNNQYGKI